MQLVRDVPYRLLWWIVVLVLAGGLMLAVLTRPAGGGGSPAPSTEPTRDWEQPPWRAPRTWS